MAKIEILATYPLTIYIPVFLLMGGDREINSNLRGVLLTLHSHQFDGEIK